MQLDLSIFNPKARSLIGLDISSSSVKMVELASEWTPPALVVELVWRRDEHLGPAARFLAKRFAECLQAID